VKLTVLVDNATIDAAAPYLAGESALSYWIETEGKKILWDTGASSAYAHNAEILGIDLAKTDYLVISHGHSDHIWGIDTLVETIGLERAKQITLITHPLSFNRIRYFASEAKAWERKAEIESWFQLQYTKEPVWLTDSLCYLGEIPRKNGFESFTPNLKISIDGQLVDDYLLDDSALTYRSEQGLVIIAGCSHAGICNTIEYAKQVTGEPRIHDVIGGFHLLAADRARVTATGTYLQESGLASMHPCHCTNLAAKMSLNTFVPVQEVGSGLVLEYE